MKPNTRSPDLKRITPDPTRGHKIRGSRLLADPQQPPPARHGLQRRQDIFVGRGEQGRFEFRKYDASALKVCFLTSYRCQLHLLGNRSALSCHAVRLQGGRQLVSHATLRV